MTTTMTKKLKLTTTSALVVAILFTVAIMASATSWTASDPGYDFEFARSNEGILPEFVEGNSPQSLTGFMSIKQDYNEDGFVFSGNDPLRFDFHPDDEDLSKEFSVWLFEDEDGVIYIHHWEATNLVIHHVLVKGGPNFFAYNYDGSLMEDGSLYSPRVGANDENTADISHFTAFFTNVPEETTTEGTTATEPTVAETLEATTEETVVITQQTVPLATETTTETEPMATTTEIEQEESTIVLIGEEIPQTGQGNTGVIAGLVLLALAASMGLLMRKVRKTEQ